MRIHGIPAESGDPISLFRSDADLKSHPCYRQAKAGSVPAAFQLVADLAAGFARQVEKLGRKVIFVAPHAEEATGDNAIPQVLAVFLAVLCRAEDDRTIVQRNRVYHTGANAMQRLIAPSEFVGDVVTGADYVLVDDVTTMGGTLADLSNYIQINGGRVVGSAVLVDASRSGKIIPEASTLARLVRRLGDEIRQTLRIEPAALTTEEAAYLTGFRTPDELGNRAAAARKERHLRLRSKGIVI